MSRPAFTEDMEATPKVFMVEQTDYRGSQRAEFMNRIRECIVYNHRNPMELAHDLKEMLDEENGRFWHVVVGTDYAAYMSFCPGSYIRASYGDLTVLMYRLG